MDDNFDMGSLPTLENLDGSTDEPVASRNNNYSPVQNNQDNFQQNAYRQNNYNPVNQNNGFQQNSFSPVNQNNSYQQNSFSPVNQNNSYQQNGFNSGNQNNGYQQNGFNSGNQNNGYQQNGFNSGNQNYQRQSYPQNNTTYNSYNQNNSTSKYNPLIDPSPVEHDGFNGEFRSYYCRGRSIAKIMGIILIVISVIDILATLLNGSFAFGAGVGIRIFCTVQFMRGKNAARIYMIVCMFISSFLCLLLSLASDYLYSVAEQSLDYSAVGFLQGIFVIFTLLYGGLGVFLIISKSIKAYFTN